VLEKDATRSGRVRKARVGLTLTASPRFARGKERQEHGPCTQARAARAATRRRRPMLDVTPPRVSYYVAALSAPGDRRFACRKQRRRSWVPPAHGVAEEVAVAHGRSSRSESSSSSTSGRSQNAGRARKRSMARSLDLQAIPLLPVLSELFGIFLPSPSTRLYGIYLAIRGGKIRSSTRTRTTRFTFSERVWRAGVRLHPFTTCHHLMRRSCSKWPVARRVLSKRWRRSCRSQRTLGVPDGRRSLRSSGSRATVLSLSRNGIPLLHRPGDHGDRRMPQNRAASPFASEVGLRRGSSSCLGTEQPSIFLARPGSPVFPASWTRVALHARRCLAPTSGSLFWLPLAGCPRLPRLQRLRSLASVCPLK